jgi:hypothetical protein
VDYWILFAAFASLYGLLAFFFFASSSAIHRWLRGTVLVPLRIQQSAPHFCVNVNIPPPNITHISRSAQMALANQIMHVIIYKGVHI